MAYNYNIPQPTDQLSVSQGQLLGNLRAVGSIAGNTNAASASINTNSGFNWVYLPSLGGTTPPPAAAFPAGQLGIYGATNSVTSINELYVNKYNVSTAVQIPMTASILSTNATPTSSTQGWSYLASGIVIYWGYSTVSGGTQLITLNAGPILNALLNVQLTVNGGSPGAVLSAQPLSATTFNINSTTSSTTNVFYYVIGY